MSVWLADDRLARLRRRRSNRAEWPRLSARYGNEARRRRERAQRKSEWKLVKTETEEFAASVERRPRSAPHDRGNRPQALRLADDERRALRRGVGQDAGDVLHVLRLLVVGGSERQRPAARRHGWIGMRATPAAYETGKVVAPDLSMK